MSNQRADGLSLVLDDLFLQVVRDADFVALRVVVLQSCVRVVTMDVVGGDQQVLLDLHSSCQSGNLAQLTAGGDLLAVGLVEVMGGAALRRFLDHLDSLVPGAVGQGVQDLLESGTVLQVSAELGGQEQIFVGADEVVVGVLDEVAVLRLVDDQRGAFCNFFVIN